MEQPPPGQRQPAAAAPRHRKKREKHVIQELQERVRVMTNLANQLERENRFLQARAAVLQGLVQEVDGIGWMLTNMAQRGSAAPGGQQDQDESIEQRAQRAWEHTRHLLATAGLDVPAVQPDRRPLVVWLERPAELRAQFAAMTGQSARELYKNHVCDANLLLILLQHDFEVNAVVSKLEDTMGKTWAWLLGLLLWRPDLAAELGTTDLMEGRLLPDQDLWRRVAMRLTPTQEQFAAVELIEELLGPFHRQLPTNLSYLLAQHQQALRLANPDQQYVAHDAVLDQMSSSMHVWHSLLILQLLFFHVTFTPIQLARVAVAAYPFFLCEGALTEQLQLLVQAQHMLSPAAAATAAAAAPHPASAPEPAERSHRL